MVLLNATRHLERIVKKKKMKKRSVTSSTSSENLINECSFMNLESVGKIHAVMGKEVADALRNQCTRVNDLDITHRKSIEYNCPAKDVCIQDIAFLSTANSALVHHQEGEEIQQNVVFKTLEAKAERIFSISSDEECNSLSEFEDSDYEGMVNGGMRVEVRSITGHVRQNSSNEDSESKRVIMADKNNNNVREKERLIDLAKTEMASSGSTAPPQAPKRLKAKQKKSEPVSILKNGKSHQWVAQTKSLCNESDRKQTEKQIQIRGERNNEQSIALNSGKDESTTALLEKTAEALRPIRNRQEQANVNKQKKEKRTAIHKSYSTADLLQAKRAAFLEDQRTRSISFETGMEASSKKPMRRKEIRKPKKAVSDTKAKRDSGSIDSGIVDFEETGDQNEKDSLVSNENDTTEKSKESGNEEFDETKERLRLENELVEEELRLIEFEVQLEELHRTIAEFSRELVFYNEEENGEQNEEKVEAELHQTTAELIQELKTTSTAVEASSKKVLLQRKEIASNVVEIDRLNDLIKTTNNSITSFPGALQNNAEKAPRLLTRKKSIKKN